MSPSLLSAEDAAGWVADHDEWELVDGTSLRRSIECETFPAGIELVGAVAEAAERVQHHPDIDIRWRTVTFVLSTHSAGGLTANDLSLAETIDRLASR